MERPAVLILGCGFTGSRVATRMAALGLSVFCTSRSGHAPPGCRGIPLDVRLPDTLSYLPGFVPRGSLVLQSIPLIESAGSLSDPTPVLVEAIRAFFPSRVVCLSTTGVYGAASHVDETTEPAPRTPRERLRLDGERTLAAGPWSTLVLRPAAIYGPFRGVHASVREGRFRVPEGGGAISRIHVDDLAALAVAALLGTAAGAFPAADEMPCPSLEVAAFCAELLGTPLSPPVSPGALPETLRGDRRVDGRAIRALLGVPLLYPTYREGIRAALDEERRNSQ